MERFHFVRFFVLGRRLRRNVTAMNRRVSLLRDQA
jgi:hypothetical protein